MTDRMAETAPPERGTTTSADGTEIAFERSGSGPPLVLVYGNSDVQQFWELAGVRPAFAEHCTVYAIERRGRGESGDAGAYQLRREAEDVSAVVDSIDDPVTLLGHSGGALYSLEAARRTDNLCRLVLYEPPIHVGNHESDVEAEITEMTGLLADGANEEALVLFLRDVAGLTRTEIDAARSEPIWREMVDAAHLLPRELEAIVEYEFDAARFAATSVPTLLLSGSESPPVYRDATNALDDALPNSQIALFEGEEHAAMLTAPDRFVDEVLAFTREAGKP
ncbi:alpha/beta hydrolase [Natronoglomus mannanivorans]